MLRLLVAPTLGLEHMAEWADLQTSVSVQAEPMPQALYQALQPGKGGGELGRWLKLLEPYLGKFDYVVAQYIGAFLWRAVFRVAGDETPFALLPYFNPIALTDLYSVLLASRLRTRNDIVFAGSVATSQSFEKLGFKSNPLFPLGISLNQFRTLPTDTASLRESLGLSVKGDVLLYAGRVQRDKNVLELLEVFGLVRSVRDAELVVCYNFSAPDYLQQCLDKGTSMGNVRFVMNPPPDMLVQYYNAADLFVSTAVSVYETFGRAPLEAMACGIWPVVADYNGFRDTIAPGTGTLVPVIQDSYQKGPDVHQFADSVLALLEDRTMLRKNSRRCIQRAQLFGRRQSLERMLNVLGAMQPRPGDSAGSLDRGLMVGKDLPGLRALWSLVERECTEDLLAHFLRTGHVPIQPSQEVKREVYDFWFSHY